MTYTYDANGNLTADGARTYVYDAADRLISLTQSGNTSTYAYNGQGDRVSQTVSGVTTRYTLDLASLYTQVLADGSTSYLYGLGRIGEQQTGGWAYHLTDALGSVRQLTTSAGAVSLARRFDPYGAPLTTAGSGSSIYGFTGEQTDPSGNVFLRARYYVPGMGRFLTRDTWAGDFAQPLTLNRWAYVNGNPINMVDPSGHFFVAALAGGGLFLAGALGALTVGEVVLALVAVTLVAIAIWAFLYPDCYHRTVDNIAAQAGSLTSSVGATSRQVLSTVGQVEREAIKESIEYVKARDPKGPGWRPSGLMVAAIVLVSAVLTTTLLNPAPARPDERTHETKRKTVLIVGEGTRPAPGYEYARSLAARWPDWQILATSRGSGNTPMITEVIGNLVIATNVDAFTLAVPGSLTEKVRWDAVIFNNPHTGEPGDFPGTANLITGFKAQALQIIKPGGEVDINLTSRIVSQSDKVQSALSGYTIRGRFGPEADNPYYAPFFPRYDATGDIFKTYEGSPDNAKNLLRYVYK